MLVLQVLAGPTTHVISIPMAIACGYALMAVHRIGSASLTRAAWFHLLRRSIVAGAVLCAVAVGIFISAGPEMPEWASLATSALFDSLFVFPAVMWALLARAYEEAPEASAIVA